MINPSSSVVQSSLYAARLTPADPKPGLQKPESEATAYIPATSQGTGVPNLMAMGIYSPPTATSGAPGQSGEAPTGSTGYPAYNDAVVTVRNQAMLMAATQYGQATAFTGAPMSPAVNATV
ncbi:hypothetical protein [Sagittula sp. MA-2]|jgi:hypothetical protein|uniref:hypothetical protein n=1 Tax=Sagittula sp. MA-2 TaxID=3048007 RepID=UPI0024C3B716|nr:hypothetical protein [Sagittula sp. MA-2]WHZ37188.1 hypothetical protein QNI11_09225 [Sagittula sp. MA-2]